MEKWNILQMDFNHANPLKLGEISRNSLLFMIIGNNLAIFLFIYEIIYIFIKQANITE